MATSFTQTWSLSLLLLILSVSTIVSNDPVRMEPQQAAANLSKKVEPALPPMAKTLGIGGTVVLDVTISSEGKVTGLKAISGHPVLIQAVLDAVRQWEYRPFLQNGQAVVVITRIEWTFPFPGRSKAEETAQRDYYPAFQSCYELVRAGKATEAEPKCSEAVRIADQLPPERVLERSSSRTFLGHSLLDQGKISASIPVYEKAVEIRAKTEGADHDADFAWDNANLARAYFLGGQLEKADPSYAHAVTVFEAAIVALPEMKDRYTTGLKTTLQEYAKLKSVRGEPERARELEQKASALSSR